MQSKLKILIVLFILSVNSAWAQTHARVEIPISANTEVFPILLGNQGTMVMVQTSPNSFLLKKYDNELKPSWNINGTIGNNLDYVTHSFDGTNVYLLFSKYRSNTYEIVKVFPGAGFIEKYQIYSVDKIDISDFEAADNAIFIAGVVKNAPIVFYTDLDKRSSRVLPTAFKTTAEIQSMDTDINQKKVNITFAVGKSKDYQLIVKSFDLDGMPISEIHMDTDVDLAMMNGKLNSMNDSNLLMFGTYGFKKSIGNQKGPFSQGIYMTKIENDEITDTKYYDFTDFKNFFNYLNPKAKQRTERKVKDKKQRGKDLQITQRMLVHDIIKKDDKYILVAEAFYPEFRSNNNFMGGPMDWYSPWGFSPFWNPYRWGWGNFGMFSPFSTYYGFRGMGNNQVFDGWVYTHGVVAAFDTTGNLLWDNTIEIKDLKTPTLKERVSAIVDDNKITLSYSNKGEIFSKTFVEGNQEANLTKRPLETNKLGDIVKKTSTEDIDKWYDHYFLATGIQRIANEDEGRRNVFYMSKVSF